jgi:hypothetical protein
MRSNRILDQRALWSVGVWAGVMISSAIVRSVIAANSDSEFALGFPMAAAWVVAAVGAVRWTVQLWARPKS